MRGRVFSVCMFTFTMLLLALALPAAASPQEGYEITYYQWNSQYQAWDVVGQEYLYCFMVRPQQWGKTTFGIDECGGLKEEYLFRCDIDTSSSSVWWWTGTVWSQERVCHARSKASGRDPKLFQVRNGDRSGAFYRNLLPPAQMYFPAVPYQTLGRHPMQRALLPPGC